MDANKIQVTDENGNDLEFDVLFTFESDDTGKSYVLYYDASIEEPQVYSSVYDEEGHLFPIETPEEWEMVEEVFSSFMSEDEDDCECDHDGCCHGEGDHECEHDDEEHECCCKKNEG